MKIAMGFQLGYIDNGHPPLGGAMVRGMVRRVTQPQAGPLT